MSLGPIRQKEVCRACYPAVLSHDHRRPDPPVPTLAESGRFDELDDPISLPFQAGGKRLRVPGFAPIA